MASPSFTEIIVSLDRDFGFNLYFKDGDGILLTKTGTYTVNFYDKDRNLVVSRTSAQNNVLLLSGGTRVFVTVPAGFFPSTGVNAIQPGIGCMELVNTTSGSDVECSLPIKFAKIGTPFGNMAGSTTVQLVKDITVSGFWTPDRTSRTIGKSAVAQPLTGVAAETTIQSVTIPGGTMGPNDSLELMALWSNNNSAGAKICRARLGGVAGTVYMQVTNTTNLSARIVQTISNRGAVNSQVGHPSTLTGLGVSASGPAVSAINMAVDQTIIFSGFPAATTDTITLEDYSVTLIKS